jgi:hypothetical protein
MPDATLQWIEFGVRAALALGEEVVHLVAAIKQGDVPTAAALAAVLPPPDRILAEAAAEKARIAAQAAADAEQIRPTHDARRRVDTVPLPPLPLPRRPTEPTK